MKLIHIAIGGIVFMGLALFGLYLLQQANEAAPENDPSFVQGSTNAADYPSMNDFFLLLHENPLEIQKGLASIRDHWQPGNAIMLLEIATWIRQTPQEPLVKKLLTERLGLKEFDKKTIQKKIWNMNYHPHPDYAEFKKRLYSQHDPRFGDHFDPQFRHTIRLDEVLWGGVIRDGIPPLNNPRMLTADQASYLEDSNIVYGIEINGDARAYPKRVIAWHEIFRDTVGDVSVAGVYCTLCGSLIIYETDVGIQHYELGTSGLLYRSNKLMYDQGSKSLWSTLKGEPVVGPLVGQNIKLKQRSVVTSTWGKWKELHPNTTVLSMDTGHERDYSEGAAYRWYFDNDDLIFEVPVYDDRLKRKQEILAIRDDAGNALAITADFLNNHPVHNDTIGDIKIVVLTDQAGANRVYQCGDTVFASWNDSNQVTDFAGNVWQVGEEAISRESDQLPRYPAHRAFWFGWHNVFPETRLVK